MPDIFLYQGQVAPNDVRLTDPTVLAGGPILGAANLTGAGSMVVAGVRTRLAAASLTGAGSMVVAGVRTRIGAAALSGAGSMVVSGIRTTIDAAILAGFGMLEAEGDVESPLVPLAMGGGFTSPLKRHPLWDDQDELNKKLVRERSDDDAMVLLAALIGDES